MNSITNRDIVQVHDLHFAKLLSSAEIAQRIAAMGKVLTDKFQGKQPLMIGILNGSFIFAADLMRVCNFELEIAFIRLASYEGLTSTGKISIPVQLDVNLQGRDIIVVEDIIDSGKTMHYFLEYLRSQQVASITVATLLLKPKALMYDLPIDLIGFEIPNEFVIGYGLDYDGLGRNLPEIYQLIES